MIIAILVCEILLHGIIHFEHTSLGYALLLGAYLLAVVIMQSRWCAVWAKIDELDMKIDRLKEKKNKRDPHTDK